MGAAAVGVAASIYEANAAWRSAVQRGLPEYTMPASPRNTPGKCRGCGSLEFVHVLKGVVCSYCRVPATPEK